MVAKGEKATLTYYGLAFSLPFLFIFCAFILYPLLYGFTLAGDLSKYQELMQDNLYSMAIVNTLIYVGLGVNIKMVFSFFFSGLLTFKEHTLVKVLRVAYLLPWAIPALSAILSFRWMLNADWGIINYFLVSIGLPRVLWLNSYESAMACAIIFHIWKWAPLWTMTLFAGRLAIAPELYESAKIDGANTLYELRYITMPLMKRLYILTTVLSTIWTLGDFNTIWLLTGGDPGGKTHLISTLAYKYTLFVGDVSLGVSSYIILMPVLFILIFVLMKSVNVPGVS